MEFLFMWLLLLLHQLHCFHPSQQPRAPPPPPPQPPATAKQKRCCRTRIHPLTPPEQRLVPSITYCTVSFLKYITFEETAARTERICYTRLDSDIKARPSSSFLTCRFKECVFTLSTTRFTWSVEQSGLLAAVG